MAREFVHNIVGHRRINPPVCGFSWAKDLFSSYAIYDTPSLFVVDFLEMKRCLEVGGRLEIEDHMVEMQYLG
jgi:hypothetical protein